MLPVAAILYEPDQSPQALMADFAAELAAAGLKVGGLLQETTSGEDGCKCRMEVVELDTGRRHNLSQDLGGGSESCSLDPSALAEASGALRRGVEKRYDLLLANKFGKLEANGAGLAAELLLAMSEGVPLLTAVPANLAAEWERFSGGMGRMLPAEPQAIKAWWSEIKP